MAASLGPWRTADLSGTAKQFSGEGSDEDVPPEARFPHGVGRIVLNRLRRAASEMRRDALAIFLLAPDKAPPNAGKREPMLREGRVEVCGRIWFVSETAQSGRPLVPPSEADADMFDHAVQLGFGDVPAAVYCPSPEVTLRYYWRGIASDDYVEIDTSDVPVTPERVRQILDYMVDKIFITPDAQIEHGSSVWENPHRAHAASDSEAVIQAHMKTALTMTLAGCNIRHEQPTPIGRVDLEIEQQSASDPSGWTRPLEIEIKILRERRASGRPISDWFNERWIRRGIKQAAAYRDKQQAHAGMLCCFDMRVEDRGDQYCSMQNRLKATELSVELYRAFLYNTSEAWRTALYGV